MSSGYKLDNQVKKSSLYSYVKDHFSRIIGTTIYMSITCRPDISTQVSKAARGMHAKACNHLVANWDDTLAECIEQRGYDTSYMTS